MKHFLNAINLIKKIILALFGIVEQPRIEKIKMAFVLFDSEGTCKISEVNLKDNRKHVSFEEKYCANSKERIRFMNMGSDGFAITYYLTKNSRNNNNEKEVFLRSFDHWTELYSKRVTNKRSGDYISNYLFHQWLEKIPTMKDSMEKAFNKKFAVG